MSADADFSQMRALAFDLGKAQATVFPKFRAIVQKTMVDTKKDMRAEAQAAGAAGPLLAVHISYETKETAGGVTAVIGPSRAQRARSRSSTTATARTVPSSRTRCSHCSAT
jgi:hypothetical protein